MNLIEFNQNGIYCRQGDFYIDPWRPVNKAFITHAHSDHGRWGMKHYIAEHLTARILKYRLSADIDIMGLSYGEVLNVNGVKVSFHPAGHILGSAQIRLEYKGEVWVASGDYKTEDDGLSLPFEPIPCNAFITESTFGLPIYHWQPQKAIFDDVNHWWASNVNQNKTSIIFGYALGKAQRILQNLDLSIGPVFSHGAVDNLNRLFNDEGFKLPATTRVVPEMPKETFKNAIVIAPPSAINSPWLRRFEPYSLAIASGWMALRGARRRRAADRGFALSDHADWQSLNQAIDATGAECVYVTHGYTSVLARWLNEKGLDAKEVKTEYQGELSEIAESQSEDPQDLEENSI